MGDGSEAVRDAVYDTERNAAGTAETAAGTLGPEISSAGTIKVGDSVERDTTPGVDRGGT